ncbi:unnamed protein product [Microthlaspi erraticum]|uniref:Uncharacterized protein n=1 Tax=Microthlaspi erraticum TaxID=1685480 RepID=A0A6D2K2C4_9BRAS|nr:unnamed protein product [Microthlaspi erraticum]
MSRKGVIAKRVKTVQTALSRISAQPRSPAGRGTCSALGQIISVRLKSRPKSKPPADHATRPGKHCPAVGQAQRFTPRRARPCRASREQASRPRNPSRTTADASVRAGKNVPRPAEKPSAKSHPPTTPADRPADREIHPARPFRLGPDPTVRPIVPTDRPNAAVDPKPFLKPNPHNSSPKPAPT